MKHAFWLWFLWMFCMILYARVAKAPEAERPVRYEVADQDSIDAAYWKLKSDSINQITKR